MESRRSSVIIPLRHVEQKLSWDCGVSCVAMLLATDRERRDFLANRDRISQEEGFGASTWTIDLCYLLRRYGIDHVYTTVTLGVNPKYKNELYYKLSLLRDHERVEDRFREASSRGVIVERRSVTLLDILEHLSRGSPIIVLVDQGLLYCDACQASNRIVAKVSGMLGKCFPFQGHYVVLCGYRMSEKKLLYRNPSKSERLCSVPFDAFEKARKRFGTDEDVIFVRSSRAEQ